MAKEDLVLKPSNANIGNIMKIDADKNAQDAGESIRTLVFKLEQKDVPGIIAGFAISLGG